LERTTTNLTSAKSKLWRLFSLIQKIFFRF